MRYIDLEAFGIGDEMRPLSLHMTLVMPALAVGMYLVPLAGNADDAMAQTNVQSKKPSYRSLRQGMFALSQIDSAAVVMLGDSLTEGAQWSEITGCYFIANRGISGDDSIGVLRRLDEITNLKPAAVLLMIGVNDVNSNVPTDRIVENVQQTIERLRKAGTRVYLTLVLSVAQNFTRKINPKIDELNVAYVKLAKQIQISVVDFRAETRNEDGFLRDELSRDGIHLTAEGYRIWRDAIAPVVQKHCVPNSAPEPPQVTAPKPGRGNGTPTIDSTPTAAPSGEFNSRFGPWR